MKLIFALLVCMISFNSISAVKVGIVNIQKIIVSIKEGKAVDSTLKKSFEKKQKEIKKEEDSIRKLQEKFQKQTAVLSEAAKAKKGAEIREKIEAVRAKMMKYQKEIQKQEAELKKPILEKLSPIIDKVAVDEKIDLTFEVTQAPVHALNKVDLTDKVVKAYDAKHSK